jgi:cyclophilin family peptidyl-prolyl cis-trans isomerase
VTIPHRIRTSGLPARFDLIEPRVLLAAPGLTTVNLLTGAVEDTPYTITHQAMLDAADESDADPGTSFSFRVESVTSGTLTKAGSPVQEGATLLRGGETLIWTPDTDDYRTQEAFQVRAWDGQNASDTAIAVKVEVEALRDAPVLDSPIGSVVVTDTEDPGPIDLLSHFSDPDIDGPVYRFQTTAGTFDVHLFSDRTPITSANFRAYADAGDYDDSFIHRSMPGFVEQGGGYTYPGDEIVAVTSRGAIVNEPGISNTRGTIAMAKLGGDPDSATSEWFINLVDNNDPTNPNNLDDQNEGFTVFAEVIGDGMDVVDTIAGYYVGNFASPFTNIPLGPDYVPGESTPVDHLVMVQSVSRTNALALSIVGNTNPDLVTASIDSNGALDLDTAPGETGLTTLTVRATDADGDFRESSFSVRVHSCQYTLSPATATASSHYSVAAATRMTNLSGLADPADPESAHSTAWYDMWLSGSEASPTVTFDLGNTYAVGGMRVWNYNFVAGSTDFTGRGVASADVWVSTTGTGTPTSHPGDWTRIADDLTFDRAPGSAAYTGDVYALDSNNLAGRYVAFDDIDNFDGGNYTGLSEIRFAPLAGLVAPQGVSASSRYPRADAAHMTDGSGLTGEGLDLGHGRNWLDMWLSWAEASPTVRFDLGESYVLRGMRVWNHNQASRGTDLTGRGIETADVWVSPSGTGTPGTNPEAWTRIADDLTFERASGVSGDRGTDYALDAGTDPIRFVYFDDVANFGGGDYTGLSEVRFAALPLAPANLTPVSAQASSQYPGAFARHARDGSGLDGSQMHDASWLNMWLSNNQASPTIRFDLGDTYRLDGMHVWNYNQSGSFTGRGISSTDVWVSETGEGTPVTEPGEWTKVADDLSLGQAPGTAGYAGQRHALSASTTPARYVYFNDVANFNSGNYTGLAEVRFSGQAERTTADLTPASATDNAHLPGAEAARLRDGSGLTTPNGTSVHDTSWVNMWLAVGASDPTIRFDLGSSYLLSGMHVWNHNQVDDTTDRTGRGVETMDVWISTSGQGTPATQPNQWTRIADDLTLTQATGRADYAGEAHRLDPSGVSARYVVLTDLVSLDGGIYDGLSEVRFSRIS